MLQAIRELFDYNYWAFDRIWEAIDHLDDEGFISEFRYSFGSIRNQIIHLISSHRRWLYRLQLKEPVLHLDFNDYPTQALVREIWDEARAEFLL